MKTYQLESCRKSFENRALQLFKETFFQLIKDLDLEQLHKDLNQLIHAMIHYDYQDLEGVRKCQQ